MVSQSSHASRATNSAPSLGSSTPSSLISISADSSIADSLVETSTPTSQGSASGLASIINALEELDLESHRPHYVVVKGTSPSVYPTRYFYFSNVFELLLTVKFSASALTATGSDPGSVCCVATSKDLANAMFVEKSMAKEVQYL